jgi:integrase
MENNASHRNSLTDPTENITMHLKSFSPAYWGWTMKTGGYFLYRKGGNGKPDSYRVWFNWEGKTYNLYRDAQGVTLQSPAQCNALWMGLMVLMNSGKFKLEEWIKPKGAKRTIQHGFAQAIDDWITTSTAGPEWMQKRRWMAEKFILPFFQFYDIKKIDKTAIHSFYASLKKQERMPGKYYSIKTICNIMGELKALLHATLDSVPTFPDNIKPIDKIPPHMTEGDIDKVFEFLRPPDLRIFSFLRYFAVRPNEACGLLRKAVFLNDEPPTVVLEKVYDHHGLRDNTKTKIEHGLPIIESRLWIFKTPDLSDFVFTMAGDQNGRGKGQPYTPRRLRQIWITARLRAAKKYPQLRYVHPYALRHSWGFLKLDEGFGLDKVQAWYGHTDVRTTMKYARHRPTTLVDIANGQKVVSLEEVRKAKGGE